MIVRGAPSLPPAEAARRVARDGADPSWVTSPGRGAQGTTDFAIGWDAVAADPVEVVRGDTLAALEEIWAREKRRWSAEGSPCPSEIPIAMGWFSYDLARQWMTLPELAQPDDDWAALEFRFFDAVWVQRTDGTGACVVASDDRAAQRLLARLSRSAPAGDAPRIGPLHPVGGLSQAQTAHAKAVRRIRDYLAAGDAYQVNLARRLEAPFTDGDSLWMAAALRARAPAPHAIWLASRSRDHGPLDRAVVGNSPERFLRREVDGEIESRPIKGTRARGGDDDSDATARDQLSRSAKDRAEHVMIVDLERNDLGRVCETGSVRVDGLLRMVALPTVYHLVSTVRGRLRSDIGLTALLHATFPGGSVTGAPKKRAMEIIEELEPVRRGVYTGATGWLGAAGDLDLAVAIRTATVANGVMRLSVGGGIVADSEPEAEWDETDAKARAFADLCQSAG